MHPIRSDSKCHALGAEMLAFSRKTIHEHVLMSRPLMKDELRSLPKYLDEKRELKHPLENATQDVLPRLPLLLGSPEQRTSWEVSREQRRGSIRKRSRPDKNMLAERNTSKEDLTFMPPNSSHDQEGWLRQLWRGQCRD